MLQLVPQTEVSLAVRQHTMLFARVYCKQMCQDMRLMQESCEAGRRSFKAGCSERLNIAAMPKHFCCRCHQADEVRNMPPCHIYIYV